MNNADLNRSLVLKAARRYSEESGKLAEARLQAFGEVAADVLRTAATPFAFVQAVKHALLMEPNTPPGAASRTSAEAIRTGWESRLLAAFHEYLEPTDYDTERLYARAERGEVV